MSALGLTRGQAAYLRGALLGAGAAYAALYALGHAPLWFGPERASWSRAVDEDERAARHLDSLDKDARFRRFRPRASSRNFLEVHESTPERRVTKVLYMDWSRSVLAGVLKFGPDCEGPPRCVHGGCSAAIIDACLGVLAYHVSVVPCLTANLSVNYRDKIPLGAAVGLECWLNRKEGRKVFLEFKIFHLGSGDVLVDGSALFLQVLTSILPASVTASLPEQLRA